MCGWADMESYSIHYFHVIVWIQSRTEAVINRRFSIQKEWPNTKILVLDGFSWISSDLRTEPKQLFEDNGG